MLKYHEQPFILKEIKIEVTYSCPLACIHCSSDATPENQASIPFPKSLNIVKEAIDLNIKKISFSGGEPLQYEGLDDIISLATSNGIEVTVYSSGNIDPINERMKTLAAAGTSKIIFSIFGSQASSHELITRIHGSFKKTVTAIKAAQKTNLETEIHFVPLQCNYKELPRVIRIAKGLNVKIISILRFVPQGRGYLIKNQTLNKLQYLELKDMIKTARKGMNIRTGSPFNFLLLNDQPQCAAAIDRVIIGPDLKIYPCDAFKQIAPEEIVGTIEYSSLEKWTLRECWNKSPYLEAVRKYLTTSFADACKDCNALESCLSGCLAQKVLLSKDMHKQPDPMCIMSS